MNWRSREYLRHAQGQECQVRIDGVCNGNPETTVAAHSNQHIHGKGGALKAHDIFIAWCCSDCHKALDESNKLTYDEKAHYWGRGFERTLLEACERGILKVK